MTYAKQLDMRSLVSDQVDVRELSVILRELERQLMHHDDGAVVEFGCYVGTTSLFIRRLLGRYSGVHDFHVYDSFEGLPDKSRADMSATGEQFKTGELTASKKDLIRHFKKAGLTLPVIHKGWFSALTARDVPDGITFAFLDGDYYESIRDSLLLITPKLSAHATIVVDDYANEALPGAARAVDEWVKKTGNTVRSEASLAIIHIL